MTSQDIIKSLNTTDNTIMTNIFKTLISDHAWRHNEMRRLYAAYEGDVPILRRELPEGMDPDRANSRLANDYRGMIVDQVTEYTVGRPVTVIPADAITQPARRALLDFLSRCAISDLDFQTAENMAICGQAARLCYIDADGAERVMNIKPWEVIFIEDGATGEIQYAMIYYRKQFYDDSLNVHERTCIEWYDSAHVHFYIEDSAGGFIKDEQQERNPRPHLFEKVPLIRYENNNIRKGDFEKVESLIDAYDETLSLAQDEMVDFRLAYMLFINMDADEEDIAKAKRAGGFALPEGADMRYLTREINDVFVENQKRTLNENIYKFANRVDMSDEKFSGGAQTGESRKWKLVALENNAARKEMKMISANRRMYRVLATSWKKKNIVIDPEKITFQFQRNLPVDLLYAAEITQKLQGAVSDETRLSLLPFIDDPATELEKMKNVNAT